MRIDLNTPEGNIFCDRYIAIRTDRGVSCFLAKDESEVVTAGAIKAVLAEIKQELEAKKASVEMPKAPEELPAPPVAQMVKSAKDELSAI